MSLLDQLQTGIVDRPRRCMIYGTHGIGKSTFAANSINPVFIQTEDGLDHIDTSKFPLCVEYEVFVDYLKTIYTDKHEYKTLCIDSIDWLEKLIWEKVCDEKNVSNIDEIGYAKGYSYAMNHWQDILDALNALRNERKMNIVLVAHSKVEKFENPMDASYDRYSPRLHKHAAALIQEWCDEVLFCNYEIAVKTEDKGFNQKTKKAVGQGERVVYTEERPAYLAKNRLGLPHKMALDFSEYASYFLKDSTKQNKKSTK